MSNSRRKFFSKVLGVCAALKVGLPESDGDDYMEKAYRRGVESVREDFYPSISLTPEMLETQKKINNLTRKLMDSQREHFEKQAYKILT